MTQSQAPITQADLDKLPENVHIAVKRIITHMKRGGRNPPGDYALEVIVALITSQKELAKAKANITIFTMGFDFDAAQESHQAQAEALSQNGIRIAEFVVQVGELEKELAAANARVDSLALRNSALQTDLAFHQMHWPFKINERVQLVRTSEYYEDYRGSELYFAGAHVGENGDVDVWTKSPGEGFTDGWSMDDLEKWTDD